MANTTHYAVFITMSVFAILVMIWYQSAVLEPFRKSMHGHGAPSNHHQHTSTSAGSNGGSNGSTIRQRSVFPDNITTLGELENIDLNVPVPTNVNLIIVGDSVSRYQYTSLVYFLKFGKWINMKHPLPMYDNSTSNNQIKMYSQPIAKEAVPHMGLIWKNAFDSKDDWSNYLSTLLDPLEAVDCFEPNVVRWHKRFGVDALENRYFRDPARNNSVTFLSKHGDTNNYKIPLTFKSTWSLDDINEHNRNALTLSTKDTNASASTKKNSTANTQLQTKCITQISEETYITSNWTEFIHDFVSKFEPKPKAFMFNQGLWPHAQFQEPAVYEQIIKAISDTGMISIYKTTTKSVKAESAEIELYEQKICELVDYCLDLSWTWIVPDYLYADGGHFYEPVYSWFNLGLLDILSSAS